MNPSTHNNQDERLLAPFIESARQSAEDPDIAAAAARLRAKLPQQKTDTRRTWLPRFATLVVMITGASLMLPFLLPGSGSAAFAEVQQWFTNYRTLDVRTRIMTGDQVLTDVHVRATDAGDTRIEQSGIVQIVDVGAMTFTTLLPGQRYMSQKIEASGQNDDSLKWVEKLSQFQGEAVKLDEMRVIDGTTTVGYRLVIDAIDLALWSDAVNSAPVLLEGELPGGLQLKTRFKFDVALSPDLFRIPEGYTPAGPE